MWAASSSTTSSGGSSGCPDRVDRAKRLRQHLCGQRGEVAAEPALVVRRRAEVQRCATRRGGRPGRTTGSTAAATPRSAKGARTVSAVVYTELRVRSSRHHEARAASSASDTPADSRMSATSPTSCGVDPAHHVGHGAHHSRPRRRGAGPAAWPRWRTRTPRRPSCRRPWPASARSAAIRRAPAHVRAGAERRPVAGRRPGRPGRIDAPDLAPSGSALPGVSQQVALDAGRQHRSLPPQDGRHGQGAGLPALGRPHHHQRLRRFGHHPMRRPAARGGAQGETTRMRLGAAGAGADEGRGAGPIGRRGTAPVGRRSGPPPWRNE